ncbi:MAG TPA: pyrroline-5-carboxylate reductase [Polyangiaceae bacterium]|nr:pyrroline-5-carboxylate reductase [Polyangiaceae bacterium]
MKTIRIGFLGGGNMAGALVASLLESKIVSADQLGVAEPVAARRAELEQKHGIETTASNADVVRSANVVVLAVKPQVLTAVLTECGGSIGPDHLVVSLVAGTPISVLESRLGPGARVVRAMPNTAALARAGATALARGSSATDEDVDVARSLFDAVGKTVVLEERHLDAVTGLSGSGPAYVMLFIEALADGGVKMGLPRDVALLLAAQTVYGSAKLLVESGQHPATLKDMVTSPGGTTITGLSVLEAAGVRGSLMAAVEAATLRATELGKRS